MSSIENLSSFLTSKKYSILAQYIINGLCKFLLIYNESGDEFLISISSNRNIQHDSSLSDNFEIVQFTDFNCTNNDQIDVYSEINSDELKNKENDFLDPEEADKMMEQYQEISIDTEKSEILKKNMIDYKSQLQRLKLCTTNIKYKLGIITKSCLGVINSSNTIETFAIKKSNPKIDENKNLVVIIDIETFFESADYIHKDIRRVINNLYTILDKAHMSESVKISKKIKNLQSTSFIKVYEQKKKYIKGIDKLQSTISKIKRQERDFQMKLNKIKDTKSLTSIDAENNTFKIKRLEEDLEKIQKFKIESANILADLRMEYNNFILNMDYSFFDMIKLFGNITSDLQKIGVLKCNKKG